jgi:hypothetical protein
VLRSFGVSGSAKDDKPEELDPKLPDLRRASPLSGALSAPTPPRPPSQNLFDLDAPSASGAHALGLPAVTSAGVKLESPANDVREPTEPVTNESAPANDELARETADIDAQFAAVASAAELDEPLVAAQPAVKRGTAPQRFETRQLTHVPLEANFDATLKLPRLRDTLDARRGRLAVRYKSACSAFKVLASFDIGSSARKELVELIGSYETSLRAVLPPTTESGEKRDSDQLHNSLPAPGFEEHERALSKVEDRLLAADDGITEADFRANVSKEKHPVKSLLRYARVLATRRFNIGYRRDRFEYLALELLTNETSDQRLQLLPREQAEPVLHHLLAGLTQVAAPEERGPAIEHLREALDRLAEIDGPQQFFESEFFVDLHGYKISMHDQITCPEFLYLCAAVEVELHNRLLAWSRSGTPSAASLDAQLQTQQRAAEEVFTNFRRPRSTPAAKSSPRPAPGLAKEAAPQPAPPRRKKRKRAARESERPSLGAWAKLAGLALVIVFSAIWLLYSAGAFQLGTPPTTLSSSQLQELSPLLLRATLSPRRHELEGFVSRPGWRSLSKEERRTAAADLAAKLKQKQIPNAQIMAYKSPVITIEFSTVVFVDDGS